MINFKSIYKLSFYFVVLTTFVFGGSLQFLFGISNTVLTFFLAVFLFLVYFFYALLKRRVVVNAVVLFSFLYVGLIIVTAFVRDSNAISTLIYLVFPLLPLAVYLFQYINFKENYISGTKIFNIFFFIALLQLPALIIQKNFYSSLIQFNHSGQKIEWFDFMFGTFFIKSDHSLGIFLLLIITYILFNNTVGKKTVRFPKIAVFYLSLSLFLTESNISKLFLIIILSFIVVVPLYKRYGKGLKFKIAVGLLATTLLLVGYGLRHKDFIQNRLGGTIERQFSLKNAEKYYELETAKRFQIILVAAKSLETKWIGDGPYSYFDILTGEFKKTRHFTQLIWTYYDLGILGLIIVLGFIVSLTRRLDVDKGIPTLFFLGMFLAYALYTTIFSDIAILFSVFALLNKRDIQ